MSLELSLAAAHDWLLVGVGVGVGVGVAVVAVVVAVAVDRAHVVIPPSARSLMADKAPVPVRAPCTAIMTIE